MNKRVSVSYAKLMFFIICLLFLAITVKLGIVVLSEEVDGVNIYEYAQSRNTVSETLLASRGTIYDYTGNPLASTVNSYTVIAYLSESRTSDINNPKHVTNPEETALALYEILGLDYNALVVTLSKDKYQVELAWNITELTKSEIDALNLAGIGYIVGNTRYYPNGTFASYLVGYAKKYDDGQIVGELGIEGYYNDTLTGIDGSTTYQKDAYGYTMPNTPSYTEEAISGSDIYLTIDSNIQLLLENAIDKISVYENVEWSIISVLEADTGAIVGSATNPTFNPNNLNTIEGNYLNPLVSYQYEPGSTMKTFSFGAAIEEGIYDGSKYFTSGSMKIGSYTISEFNKTGWGDITFDTGYAYSSNVATSTLALELGVSTLTSYYTSLGFGSKTGIELSNEYGGKVNFYYNIELANAAFGQGISVTPIQMLQAYTTIANDGVMLKPYIIDKIVGDNGETLYQSEVTEVAQVFSKETTDYLKKLMSDAVYNSTNSYYIPNNITIMGKTGTAQIAENGSYLTGSNDYIRSFVSIFPEDKPKYIFYIAVSKYDGLISDLSKIITTTIEEIAGYANITDPVETYIINEPIKLNNYISSKTIEASNALTELDLDVVVVGDGDYIIDQYPDKNTVLFAGDKIFLTTNYENLIMPDITNYSASDLKTLASLLNLEYISNGYGYVIDQSIEVGTILTGEENLIVNLG